MTTKLLIDRELLERCLPFLSDTPDLVQNGAEALGGELRAILAAPQPSAVPNGFVLVPVEPTQEMVSAAEEAHMPFGDMDIALRMAILSAPSAPATVQGVNAQLLEALEECAASLAWNCFGECRAIHAGRIMPAQMALETARAAIAAARQEGGKV